jgi:hypothetical protein
VTNVPVNGGGIGPIRFDRDDLEAVVLDQVAGDRRSSLVELRRAVAGFAQQNDAGLREAI